MGGQDVNTVQDFTQILQSSKIGDPLVVKYWRGTTEHTASVTPIVSPKPSTG